MCNSDQPIIAQVAQPFEVCVLHHVVFAQSRESVFPVDVQRDQSFCNYNNIYYYALCGHSFMIYRRKEK